MAGTLHIAAWPALMRRETAAAYLDMSPRKLDELQARSVIIPVDTDAGKRFTLAELNRYIETRPEWGADKD